MRIIDLGNTATDFASDDYIAIDGTTNGSRKMKKDSLLQVTAQSALAGNVVQAFDSTRDVSNPYNVGEPVVYNGKTYIFKISHYGAWDLSHVIQMASFYSCVANLSTKEAQGNTLESGFYSTSGTNVGAKTDNANYVCAKISCKKGDKFLVVGQGATGGLLWATATASGLIVRKSAANALSEVTNPTYITIDEGENIFVFNSHISALPDVRRVNVNEVLLKLENKVDGNFEEKKVAYTYKVANGVSARLSFYYTPSSGEEVFNLNKTTYSQNSFSVFASDSSGVNPNYEYLSSVPFNTDIYLKMPTGYDRWLFYKSNIVLTGIDVTLFSRLNSIASNVENLNSVAIKGKKILCLGDSITQYKYQARGYTDYLAMLGGAEVYNAGVGGTRYAVRTTPTATPSSSTEAWAALDMYNLVYSWLNNDWTIVDAGVSWLSVNEGRTYLANIVNVLKNISINDIDIITLFAGTNDWASGTSKGAVNNNDSSTLLGAISMIIEELLASKPTLKIFVFTPVVRWVDYSGIATSNPDNFSDVKVSSGRTLKELSSWIYEAVTTLHIPICDLYNTLGWNQYNFNGYFLDTDGTHPYNGFDSLAKKMYGFMTANNW